MVPRSSNKMPDQQITECQKNISLIMRIPRIKNLIILHFKIKLLSYQLIYQSLAVC